MVQLYRVTVQGRAPKLVYVPGDDDARRLARYLVGASRRRVEIVALDLVQRPAKGRPMGRAA